MKKAVIFILAAVSLGFILIAGNNSGVQPLSSKSFNVQKGGLLTVDVEPGAVEIESWDKDEVTIDAYGIDERHPERFIAEQSGSAVSLKYRDSRSSTNLKFVVRVPVKFNADIKTSGGSVTQRNKLDGYLKAQTDGGSVEIDEVMGKVNAKTDGGGISVNKLGADGDLETGGGSIDVKFASASLNLKTGGGSIELGEIKGKTDATTGGGSIETKKSGGPIQLKTGGGSIEIQSANEGAIVETGGGSIELGDIHGFITASTGGGSISAELIPDAAGNSSIKTGGGEINFSIPENAKATIEARIIGYMDDESGHPRITSDFNADNNEGRTNHKASAVYKLNGGGHKITLETSYSSIRIRKLRSK